LLKWAALVGPKFFLPWALKLQPIYFFSGTSGRQPVARINYNIFFISLYGFEVYLLKFYYFSNVKSKRFIYLSLTTNFLFYFVELDDDNNINKDDRNLLTLTKFMLFWWICRNFDNFTSFVLLAKWLVFLLLSLFDHIIAWLVCWFPMCFV
jgi:hypothetical protein